MDAAIKDMFASLAFPASPAIPPHTAVLGVIQQSEPLPPESFPIADENLSNTRMYSKEEWEARRPQIEQLYATRTLDATIIALEEYGFSVTVRQLKRKVKDWGLRKNLKKAERVAILLQEAHAEANGEVKAFSLQNPVGVTIGPARIERMKRRDGTGLNLYSGAIPEVPPAIKCELLPGDHAMPLIVPDTPEIQKLPQDLDALDLPYGETIAEPAIPPGVIDPELFECHEPTDIEDTSNGLDVEQPVDGPPLPNVPLSIRLAASLNLSAELSHCFPGSGHHEEFIPEAYDGNPFEEPLESGLSLAEDATVTMSGTTDRESSAEHDDQKQSEQISVTDVGSGRCIPLMDHILDDMPLTAIIEDQAATSSPRSTEVALYRGSTANVGHKYPTSREEALAHARGLKRITDQFDECLASLGLLDTEESSPKLTSKRKRRVPWVYTPAANHSSGALSHQNSVQTLLRPYHKDSKRLYEFGFRPVRQLDDSISMILPPPTDILYLREVEEQRRELVYKNDMLYGSDDTRTIDALSHFCDILEAQHRYSEAQSLTQWSSTARRKLQGDSNEDTFYEFLYLATIFILQQSYSEARKLLSHIETLASYYLGKESKIWLEISLRKCDLLSWMGSYAEAEAQCWVLLPALISAYGSGVGIFIMFELELSFCLQKQGKLAESKDILNDIIHRVEKVRETFSSMLILEAKRDLASVLIAEGSIEQGKLLRESVNKELAILRPGVNPEATIIY